MNQNVSYIKQRLSLRKPQEEALEILADIAAMLPLTKENDLKKQVELIHAKYPTFRDFERKFPNICFALATGVGKTRLMGAFVVYLYKTYHVTDFLIMPPNLTIYKKLIDDFSKPTNSKYVFKGIADFATNPPLIITGDNYREMNESQLFQESVRINIFNISKVDFESKKGELPRIKRLSEYLGQSYFNYLVSREKLVLLMDESHHYRSKKALQVINELNPVLGIEVTATPYMPKGSKSVPFKNVVYSYSLAKAMNDGFVKLPAVATRGNWNADNYTPEEIDRFKVLDGVRLHQNTRVALEKYARNHDLPIIKPFVLIVTKDTTHAEKIKQMIQADDFDGGYYKDKVIVVHSNQQGEERDENIGQLLSLENPLNKIEIVIHVNMLKEGWDVTNLYTIVPLRTSAADTLTEQTIGRGLRLPYGKITGEKAVDTLAIVAHDKFQAIVEAAKKEGSIIRKENIIELDDSFDQLPKKKIIVSNPVLQTKREETQQPSAWSELTPEMKTAAAVFQNTVLPAMGTQVQHIGELSTAQVQAVAFKQLEENLAQKGDLFAKAHTEELKKYAPQLVEEFTQKYIPIPRVTVVPGKDGYLKFEPFELDTTNITYQPVSEDILLKSLIDGSSSFLSSHIIGEINQEPSENILLGALFDVPEISYDDYADLLYTLVQAVTAKLRSYLTDEAAVKNVVVTYRRQLADFIFAQMKQHSRYIPADLKASKVYPFERIYPHNYEMISTDKLYHYADTIEPTSLIPSKVFTGFKKACHALYKFDSKAEKDFACVLEESEQVLKWLRPHERQFSIYWGGDNSKYEPDFVVETDGEIYLTEIKSTKDINSEEVAQKAKAARLWIDCVNKFTARTGGKKWVYLLIPHTEVKLSNRFDFFKQFEK